MTSSVRHALVAAAVSLGLALVAGCGGAGGEDPGDGAQPSDSTGTTGDPTDTPPGDPVDLIDLWRVSGAEGEESDTWLRLEAGQFQLWRDCGMLMGEWAASSTLFLASISSWSGSCSVDDPEGADDAEDATIPAVPWLDLVTEYRSAASGWDLLDADGAVVATLSIDGAPEPIDTAASSYAEPPEVTDEVRAWLAAPAPLPDGVTPASEDDLVGRWIPIDTVPTDPHVEFAADGTWTGSDGCNGGGGRWVIDPDGLVLTTSGPQTLIGCEGAPVPSWVAMTRTAALDGAVLSLFDRDGELLGELAAG
ncbi:hypothetical protein [Occultella aeris]|nr:hypothetical protein [Occultella aeris]